jgi:hypothetical protein
MKKSRLQELAGIKKTLNEGYAWERDENGALPTLESSTAKHAESMKEVGLNEEYNLKIKTIAEELLELVKQDEERGGALSGGSVDYPLFYDLASAIMEKHKVR